MENISKLSFYTRCVDLTEQQMLELLLSEKSRMKEILSDESIIGSPIAIEAMDMKDFLGKLYFFWEYHDLPPEISPKDLFYFKKIFLLYYDDWLYTDYCEIFSQKYEQSYCEHLCARYLE